MKIVLLDRQEKIKIDTVLLKKISSYISGKFNRDKNAELNIVFVEKEEMAILNEKYHGGKGPTDVLSFSYCSQDKGLDSQKGMQVSVKELFDDLHGFTVAGEIIICPEVAESNAKKNNPKLFPGWSTLREIIVLIIHGILHIYDYDHATREELLKMESIQNSILNDVVSSFNA